MMRKELVLLWTVALCAAIQVDDSNKSLKNIPATYNVNITSLILHNNSIVMNSSDTEALNKYSKLTKLDLSYNLIMELPNGAFSALSNLDTIYLRGNKLQTMRNETFANLKNLKTLDLTDNPWNCTQKLLTLMKWMNEKGLQMGENATCANPRSLAGKRILNVLQTTTEKLPPVTSSTATTQSKPASTSTTVTASTKNYITRRSPPHAEVTTGSKNTVSSKGTETKQDGKLGTTSWMFLTGVIMIIICTSMILVCAVKSPTWYKMLFNYRHQRLREAEEPSIFNTGRYSNFSLDTEQTETSAHELDQGLTGPTEDEDGFIEDGYIQPEDYKEHADFDEV
ncbi:leucine-rich repeat-containing protein 19-like [Clarias gariepinus]